MVWPLALENAGTSGKESQFQYKSIAKHSRVDESYSFAISRNSRVEDRNDPLVQKMRRYITAFSKDGEPPKEKAETGKPDPGNNQPEANLDVKSRPRIQRRPIKCWQLIRQSIASEKEENVDSEDNKYI